MNDQDWNDYVTGVCTGYGPGVYGSMGNDVHNGRYSGSGSNSNSTPRTRSTSSSGGGGPSHTEPMFVFVDDLFDRYLSGFRALVISVVACLVSAGIAHAWLVEQGATETAHLVFTVGAGLGGLLALPLLRVGIKLCLLAVVLAIVAAVCYGGYLMLA